MTPVLFAFYALWITPALAMALVSFVLWRRGWHRELRAFFCYAVFTAARTPVLFLIFHRFPEIYGTSHSVAEGVSAVLGFAAIREVFRLLFESHPSLRQWGLVLFRWTAAGFILLAALAAASPPEAGLTRLAAVVVTLTQGVRLVQCGLLLFLFAVAFFCALPWRSHLFGIAVGFGLFAAVQLATAAMEDHLGLVTWRTTMWVNMASYNCSALMWAGYLLTPQRAESAERVPSAEGLMSWNKSLQEFLSR